MDASIASHVAVVVSINLNSSLGSLLKWPREKEDSIGQFHAWYNTLG